RIPAFGFSDFLQPEEDRARKHGRWLAETNFTHGKGLEYDESVAYLGMCYADLEDRIGVSAAKDEYAAKGRHAFLPIGPLRRVLERVRPDLVVVTSSPKSERAAVIAARQLGIPSVSMIDLFGMEWDYLYEPDYADRMFVMSDGVREDFLARGRHPNSVVTTGNPAFDRLADPSLRTRGDAWRDDLGIGDAKLILWTATTVLSDSQRAEVFVELGKWLQKRPHWRLVFRPHPNMSYGPDRLPPGVLYGETTTDVAVQIHGADCVLVTISTTGIEAALLDKPVVKMCLTDPDFGPYHRIGLALPAKEMGDIGPTIEAALTDCRESRAVREARHRLPRVGDATRNVVDQLARFAAQRNEQVRLAG
ncbi:MAG: hypothetical protein ABI619_13715, partial [Betaproteobacteria bacterium]